jgi:hypothetical protein
LSCCAAAPGSTIPTTAAPPTGTATTRPTSTPTLVFVPAVSSPQHPSPSELLKGIPTGVQEGSQTRGSRPAPVIGAPHQSGLSLADGRTIRTAPAHCPMASDLGAIGGLSFLAPQVFVARRLCSGHSIKLGISSHAVFRCVSRLKRASHPRQRQSPPDQLAKVIYLIQPARS